MGSLWRFMKIGWGIHPIRLRLVISQLLLIGVVGINLLIPSLIRRIIDLGIDDKDMEFIFHAALRMVFLSFIGLALAVLNVHFAVDISVKLTHHLRMLLYRKVQTLSYGNLDRNQTSDILVRLTSDVNAVKQMMIANLILFFQVPVVLVGSVLIVAITIPGLTWIMMLLLLVSAFFIIFYTRITQPLYTMVQHRLDRLNQIFEENLAGVRVVKIFVRSDYEINRYDERNVNLRSASLRPNRLTASLKPSILFAVNLGTVAAIWFGGSQAIDTGDITIGQIVAFSGYLSTATIPLVVVASLIPLITASNASLQRIFTVLDSAADIQEPDEPVHLPEPFRGRVVFENVNFSYTSEVGAMHASPVLRNINLTVEPGEVIAIFGATGSGKTSLINLIPRFYDVTSGRVLIDGIDVRNLALRDLRQHVVMVPQRALLFSGTIRDNIRYGKPEADEDAVVNVARIADAYDFIRAIPGTFDAEVERNGDNFSGGQRQRVALARGLIMEPKILIMDDSTSAVDLDTESRIHARLKNTLTNTTTFIVAQRISTVLIADRVVVLDEGQIVANGTHGELMQSSPIYREIYRSQLAADETGSKV